MKTSSLNISNTIHDEEGARQSRASRLAYPVLLVVLFSHILVVIILCFTPPISRDALIHHLAIPKLWLKNGGFYEIPWAKYSYYPMNIELLYLTALYFKNDIAPKIIHFAFGLATGSLIYLYLKTRLGRNWGLLGALMYLTTPIVIRLSASAYVDLGLVFFTTAAIFSMLRWQDGHYRKLRWLVISAVCMGLAAGCKYNGLLVWTFLNLLLVFYYAKDTQKQLPALKYGLLFFVISLVIVSPWYVKNYVLTSNPIFPLLDNVFNPPYRAGGSSGGSGGIGFFQRRELMYGESFWETLLIPMRMFFQGQDHSDQHFDGVLNPILIVMLPFAFLNKGFRRDKVSFLSFSFFFLISTFFLAAARVRYILPVIPLLVLLAVMGVKGLVDQSARSEGLTRYILLIATFAVTAILLGCNALYLKDHFRAIKPVEYILNKEAKDDFLTRHIGSYPAVRYVNKYLPADAKIFLVLLAGRGYYLDRDYYHEPSFGMKAIRQMVNAARSESEFLLCLQSLKCSHILMRTGLFKKYLRDNFEQQTISRFLDLARQYWKRLYEANDYAVYELSDSPPVLSSSVLGSAGL